jgi:hypothetical protein
MDIAILALVVLEEMMWGGWTCPNCGCKVDRYGKERVES